MYGRLEGRPGPPAPSLAGVSERIPLFPLGTVLYPGQPLPLHIFESRYRQLVRTLLDLPPERREFGVLAIREGREVGTDGVRALHDVGCAARLERVADLPDGRFDILTVGTRRFALEAVDGSLAYLQGDVRWLPESGGEATVVAPGVRRLFVGYRDAVLGPTGPEPPDDPRALSYHAAATMVLDLADHQALLAAPDDGARLRTLATLLRRERAVLRALPSLPGTDYARVAVSPN